MRTLFYIDDTKERKKIKKNRGIGPVYSYLSENKPV